MKKTVLIAFVLCFLNLLVCGAQNYRESGFWGDLEVSYGISLAGLSDNYGLCEPANNSVTSLQLSLGYYIRPGLSLGLAAGVSGYVNPGLNYVPIMLDVRCRPFDNGLLLDCKAGTQIAINEKAFRPGFCAEVFCGWKVLHRGFFHIVPGLAYNFTGYGVTDSSGSSVSGCRNVLSVKLQIGFGGR